MKAILSLVVAALAVCCAQSACAQPIPRSQEGLNPYNVIELISADGEVVHGVYLSVSADSVFLLARGKVRSVAIRELRQCAMEFERTRSMSDFLSGALLFGQLGGLGFATKEGQPLGYVARKEGRIHTGIAAFLGGIVGLGLTGPGVITRTMILNEPGSDSEEERDALLRFLRDERVPRFHLSVHGGQVGTRVDEVKSPSVSAYGTFSFTLLRKLQLTYSLSPTWEVGLAWMNIAEPGFRVSDGVSYSESFSSGSVYAVIVNAKPFARWLPEWIVPYAGAAIGKADIEFYQTLITSGTLRSIRSTGLAYDVFAGLDLLYSPSCSVGFVVDHAAVPSLQFPAEPALGLSSRTIANTCIGFSIGFHL